MHRLWSWLATIGCIGRPARKDIFQLPIRWRFEALTLSFQEHLQQWCSRSIPPWSCRRCTRWHSERHRGDTFTATHAASAKQSHFFLFRLPEYYRSGVDPNGGSSEMWFTSYLDNVFHTSLPCHYGVLVFEEGATVWSCYIHYPTHTIIHTMRALKILEYPAKIKKQNN